MQFCGMLGGTTNGSRRFKRLAGHIALTCPFDRCSQYNFGGLYSENGVLVKDTREYWHQLFWPLGIYIRKDSWLGYASFADLWKNVGKFEKKKAE